MTFLVEERPIRRPSEIDSVQTNLGDMADAFAQLLLRYMARNGDRWDVVLPVAELEGQAQELLAGSSYLRTLEKAGRESISMTFAWLVLADSKDWKQYFTIENDLIGTTREFERLCDA